MRNGKVTTRAGTNPRGLPDSVPERHRQGGEGRGASPLRTFTAPDGVRYNASLRTLVAKGGSPFLSFLPSAFVPRRSYGKEIVEKYFHFNGHP